MNLHRFICNLLIYNALKIKRRVISVTKSVTNKNIYKIKKELTHY